MFVTFIDNKSKGNSAMSACVSVFNFHIVIQDLHIRTHSMAMIIFKLFLT